MRVTLKQINKQIEIYGFELHRGNGYFWFYQFAPVYPQLYNSCVMVNTLSQLTVDQWERELVDKIRWTK
jgi:hypothetical protein